MAAISAKGQEEFKAQSYVRIGDEAGDFDCVSQLGPINWHKYIDGKWAILCSHPKDFTPVCTTEIGRLADLKEEWAKRNVVVAVVSVDTVERHGEWITEINRVTGATVDYPLLADPTKAISMKYGMLDQEELDAKGLPLTVRSVFIIDPNKKIKAIITYPASTGRNFTEIIRVVDSLQSTATQQLATPVDWVIGGDFVVSPAINDEDALKRFPDLKIVSASCKLRTTKGPQ